MKNFVLIMMLALSTSFVACKKRSCEKFIENEEGDLICRGGKTIYSFNGQGRNFFAAEANCVAQGGHLVGIQNEKEADFLLAEMEKRGITLAWTGLNDHKDNTIDGTFEYSTGIDGFVPLSPLPSNSILKDCAALQVGNENKFEVRSCGGTTKIWSICKMNYFRQSIIFVPAEVPQRDESDGVLTELNWSDADQECKNKGGELMNICGMNSVILRRILRKRNIDAPVWIGMNYDTSKKKFFWRNGVSKFRRWCRGEPSLNPDPLAPNQCVAYIVGGKPRGRGTGKGCIRVEPCGTTTAPNKKMFVCQIKESTNNDLVNDTLNEVEK